MLTFEGIYTPAITPYAADGSIDFARFSDVLESLIEARVHGIIIGGSTGEYYAQSPEERKALVEHARQVIGSRLPLIVGTGAIRCYPGNLAAVRPADRAGNRPSRASRG